MKKNICISIIIILILINLIISFIYIPYIANNSTFIIINDNTVWKKTNDTWKNVSIRSLPKFSYNKVYSFDGSSYIGETYNDYSNNLVIYDKNYEKIELENELLSIYTKEKIKTPKKIYDFSENEIDSNYIKIVLEKYSIKSDYQFKKYEIDINGDGEEDKIYNISNFYMNDLDDRVFSIVFSVINEHIEIIDYVLTSKEDELKEQSININHIVDVDNDNKYEIILSKSAFGDSLNDCNTLYKYDLSNNKYIKLIGC